MCEECYSAVCFEGCPYLRDKLARAACDVCGEPIREGDRHYGYGQHRLCADCAEQVSVEELLEMTALREPGELLELLGFRSYA